MVESGGVEFLAEALPPTHKAFLGLFDKETLVPRGILCPGSYNDALTHVVMTVVRDPLTMMECKYR